MKNILQLNLFTNKSECISNKIKELEATIIDLNTLLDMEDKVDDIKDLSQEMKKLQAKKYLTTNELAEIYNISTTSQANLRGRLYDSLPYHQKVFRGKILYIAKEIDNWLENQYK